MHSDGPAPTKMERLRWSYFAEVGCVVCRVYLRVIAPPQTHHLLSGNRRRGHRYTIPLCPAHHQGIHYVPAIHRASVAVDQRAFRELFGSDDELLVMSDRLIEAVMLNARLDHIAVDFHERNFGPLLPARECCAAD